MSLAAPLALAPAAAPSAGEATALIFSFPALATGAFLADTELSSPASGSRAYWTANGGEKKAELVNLWLLGLSHGCIARQMGISRGKVSAKIDRLGLERNSPTIDGRSFAKRAERPEPVAPPINPAWKPLHLASNAGCRWPEAYADGEHLFCDEPRAKGAYCCFHASPEGQRSYRGRM